MHVYQIFKHPEKGYKAVKRGFSWPGFFFTSIWTISRQMWLATMILVLISSVWTVIAWQLAVEDVFFPLVVGLLIQLIVGFKGNSWRCGVLEGRGCAPMGAINARDPEDAVAKVTATNGVISQEFKAERQAPAFVSLPTSVQQLFAMISLTWKAAFRYRLFWVVTALLLLAVVGLPMLVKDDGTAEGFAQILITYTLTAVTILLGFCTLWLACGTLARDIEECQMQMLAVKPVARWQIWLGKWLGLVSLNATLLAMAGLSIYGLLEWRAKKLPEFIQFKLKNEVLVARGSAREQSFDSDIEKETRRRMELIRNKDNMSAAELLAAQKQIHEQVKAEYQVVAPAHQRPWTIHLGEVSKRLKNQPLFLRIKFNVGENPGLGATYGGLWFAGTFKKTHLYRSELMSLSADTFHEFPIDANVFDENGDLRILYVNPNNVAVLFPLEDGLEVLYRVGGFGANFVRGLGIILCWLALVAALGLAAASLLSFPVAAFFSLAILTMGLFSGTLANVVSDGTIMGWNEEAGTKGHSPIDEVVVPMFRGMLKVIDLVKGFSPIDSLSTGREIPWPLVALAAGQIVVLLGGCIGLVGIFIFSRRELATAQGTH